MSQITIKESQVFLVTECGQDKLALKADGLEILFEDTQRMHHAAWVKNTDGYFYVAGEKIKKLDTANLTPIDADYAKQLGNATKNYLSINRLRIGLPAFSC